MVYNICLTAHIVGITLMAGTAFMDVVIYNRLWKTGESDKKQAALLEDIGFRLQRFIGVGMLLIILSGVGMMVYLHQVWGQQLWFRVKMVFLILIIINGMGIRRRIGGKLRVLLTDHTSSAPYSELARLRSRLTLVQYLQLFFFVVIFTLSVFKFN